MSDRTIIIGGGAIGLSLAWELARRGDQVTLLEREPNVGAGTSWAAAGILPPANLDSATDPIDQLRGLSHRMFSDWVDQLQSDTGIDPGYRRCGGWYLAATPGERAAMIGMTDYWNELGIDCQSISPREFSKREPALHHLDESQTDAWWVPDECQIRCPDYLDALSSACSNAGVDIRVGAEVHDLSWGQGWAEAFAHGETLRADRAVVCGGAWTGRVTSGLQLDRSVVPVRGQILLLKTEQPLLRSIVNVGQRYVLCRDDGHTLIGSCEQEVGFTLGTEESMLSSLRRFAVELVPELVHAETVNAWSGLRPLTFDGFPMIGKLPESDSLYVAAGHYRSGIHLSPATAVTLADLIHGQSPSVDLDAFRIGKQQSKSSPLDAIGP